LGNRVKYPHRQEEKSEKSKSKIKIVVIRAERGKTDPRREREKKGAGRHTCLGYIQIGRET